MIVPRNRLLLWVSVIVLPFAFLGAVEPGAAALSIIAIGGLGLLVLADAIGSRTSLAGIGIALPDVARMSRDRPAKLDIRIRNEHQKSRNLRLALALPREIQSPQEELAVVLPKDSEWSRLTWPCRPIKRGNYKLHTARVEANSPLGFWAVRKNLPTPSQIRVYPNLLNERKSLAALFLHRGSFGMHAQRQIGKGRDFEKLREYIPGDSYDEVHWKATAKRGRPVTKIFQIERTQEVYVVIDASRLSARPVENSRLQVATSPKAAAVASQLATFNLQPATAEQPATDEVATTTLERFVTAALVLGLAAEQQGDLFGLLTFTNKVETFVRAKNGKAHFSACRDALYTLQPQIVTPDYDEVFTFIRLRLRRRALLIVLTSLDDSMLAASFVKNMDLIQRQHLVLVNMLQPPGIAPVFSNPNLTSVDDLYQHLGGHLLWHNLRELEKVLHRRGVRFSLLKNERLSAELVSQYLNVKQRQLI
jgi:uncharacterized protein (DUF58 family)